MIAPDHPIVRESTVVRSIVRLKAACRVAVDESRIHQLARSHQHVVESSVLYRWLTVEPDPEVIVVDLRETWTVGPALAALDRSIATLHPALASSRLAALARHSYGLFLARPVRVLTATRGYQRLVAAFEPPEPPEPPETEDTDESGEDRNS